jgi:hypothetical protein
MRQAGPAGSRATVNPAYWAENPQDGKASGTGFALIEPR